MTATVVENFSCSYLYANPRTGSGELSSNNYKVEAEFYGGDSDRFIAEFSELHKIVRVNLPDKKFISGPFISKLEETLCEILKKLGVDVYTCPFDVSAETLCDDIAARIENDLAFDITGVQLVCVKLHENENSCVTWHK